MYKRISILFLLVSICMVGLLSGCNTSAYNNKNAIIADEDSYTYRKSNDEGSTDSSLNREFAGFSGKDTIWTLEAETKTDISINLSTDLEKGKFKVLLVTNNDDIEILLEGEGTKDETIEIEAGTPRIIIVGDDASGICQISFDDLNGVVLKNSRTDMNFDDWFSDWMN